MRNVIWLIIWVGCVVPASAFEARVSNLSVTNVTMGGMVWPVGETFIEVPEPEGPVVWWRGTNSISLEGHNRYMIVLGEGPDDVVAVGHISVRNAFARGCSFTVMTGLIYWMALGALRRLHPGKSASTEL